jgi:hypothetical protein
MAVIDSELAMRNVNRTAKLERFEQGTQYAAGTFKSTNVQDAIDELAGVTTGTGTGAIADSPMDGTTYGRNNGVWINVLALSGGTMTGSLVLQADPSVALGAATKQYVDAHGLGDAPTDGSTYARRSAVWVAVRTKLTTNLVLYVATTGSDSNSGIAPSSPFATLQKAANVVMDTLDLNGFTVTVHIADGTYSAGVVWDRPVVGGHAVGGVVFQGNASTPANVLITTTSGSGFQASGPGCNFQLVGMTIAAVYDIYALYGGQIYVGANVVLSGVSVASSIYAYATRYGYIEFQGSSTFNGAGTPEAILEATHHGNIRIATGTQGLTGAITTAVAFAYSLDNGDITVTGGATFFQVSGSTVGVRYLASGAVIQWSGGSETSFPGTVLGTLTHGGQYIVGPELTNGVVPENSQSANYTTVLPDAGKFIYHPFSDANARTFTIDSNANVGYAQGTVISFANMSVNPLTIAINADTMYLAGPGTTGSRTLAQYGVATALKTDPTAWIISGTNLT